MSVWTKLPLFILLVMLPLAAVQCVSQPAARPAAKTGRDGVVAGLNDGRPGVEIEGEVNFAALSPIPLAAGEKLKVVATTNIIADIVGNVGGEAIELTPLLPLGVDPHTFIPSPRDMTAVVEADLIFINGLGLETFLADLIANAGGQAVIVSVSQGVEPRALTGDQGRRDEDHDPEGLDPHTWLSPANALIFVHNIERALSALDPANAPTYRARAGVYAADLAKLDAWIKEQIASIPAENRKLAADHDTFGYYADRYGLDLVGAVIPAYSTEAEPSARELAELQMTIRDLGVKAIFVDKTANPRLAEQVAKDSGVLLVPLYTASLGQPDSGAASYLDLMRYNTTAIVEALR